MSKSINVTKGPWTYTMPKEGKSRAKISGQGWEDFARVVVKVDKQDSEQGLNNVLGIITAVIKTYHAGINPEAVPEMLEFIAAIARQPKNGVFPDYAIDQAHTIIQKAKL